MDFNWYTFEKIVHETLGARRARAEAARLAAVAPRYWARRLIGTALVKLGRPLVVEASSPVRTSRRAPHVRPLQARRRPG
jgi:hypothetical protein